MKKLALILGLLCARGLFAQTIVAVAVGSDGTGSGKASISTGTTLNVSTGQLLHVGCYCFQTCGTMTASDTGSANTFTASPDGPVGSGTVFTESFYAKNTVAVSSDTITCNYSGGGAQYVGVMTIQISGADTVTPLNTHTTGTGTGLVGTSSSFTTTAAHTLIVADISLGTLSNFFTAGLVGGTPATLQNNTGTNGQASQEELAVTSIQTGQTAAISWTPNSTPYAMSVMAYKAAAAGANVPQAGAFLPGP